VPAERDTRYRVRRRFDAPADDPRDPLDVLDDPARLGSYAALTHASEHRFHLRVR
jgi:hypothetical protein